MDFYRVLELEPGASLEDITKSYRILALKYHPDRNKDPDSTSKFIRINEAYETLCKEITGTIPPDYLDLISKSGKVNIGSPDEHSHVQIKIGDYYFGGKVRTSEDKRFSIVFSDGYGDFTDGISEKWINGKVLFIEDEVVCWKKEFERLWNCSVSNNGRSVVLYSLNNTTPTLSTPKEFVDLGCILVVLDKLGDIIFNCEFGSNCFECAISPDGRLVLISTLRPDNSIYCFDLDYTHSKELKIDRSMEADQTSGFWKYKHHSRNAVSKLRFRDNIIEVFTGASIESAKREYALHLDGKLLPEYANEVELITKVKKQRGDDKLQSLLKMIDSTESREIMEGLSLMTSFVNAKGALAHYSKIVNAIGKFTHTDDKDLFNIVWKIIKGILKKDYMAIDSIVHPILLNIKKSCDDGELLIYLGELGKSNPIWIKDELPFIKQKLRSEKWNERRLSAFAVGYIGAADISFVEDVIPLIIEYIAEPEKLAKELERDLKKENASVHSIGEIGFTVTLEKDPMEDATWIRDACIDSIGEIGKKFPESVRFAIPLLEEVSRSSPSPYSIKKALRAIDAINGKCKETFKHSV